MTRARRLDELLELLDLVLADLDLLKLDARRDEREDVGFAHTGAEELVENLDTLVADVVPSGDTTEVRRDEGAEVRVVLDHLDLDETLGRVVDEGVTLATEERILLDFGGRHAVDKWILAHAHEEIGVTEPAYSLVHVCDGTETDLGIEGVDETGGELGLDRVLLSDGGDCMQGLVSLALLLGGERERRTVVIDLVARRTDITDSLILVLRSTGTTEDLKDVQDAQIDESTLSAVVDLRSLDDDGVGGQVDTPGESGGTAEDLRDRG